jgi:hypothetical protein
MMRRDLVRRLRAVELAGSGRIEIWIVRDDDTVRGPRGEQMTFEEAEALARALGTNPVFILEEDQDL